jgi:hypothetical protein
MKGGAEADDGSLAAKSGDAAKEGAETGSEAIGMDGASADDVKLSVKNTYKDQMEAFKSGKSASGTGAKWTEIEEGWTSTKLKIEDKGIFTSLIKAQADTSSKTGNSQIAQLKDQSKYDLEIPLWGIESMQGWITLGGGEQGYLDSIEHLKTLRSASDTLKLDLVCEIACITVLTKPKSLIFGGKYHSKHKSKKDVLAGSGKGMNPVISMILPKLTGDSMKSSVEEGSELLIGSSRKDVHHIESAFKKVNMQNCKRIALMSLAHRGPKATASHAYFHATYGGKSSDLETIKGYSGFKGMKADTKKIFTELLERFNSQKAFWDTEDIKDYFKK